MKRYCQILTLVDDAASVAAYVEAHRHVWPVVLEGIREVGILDMQIYLKDNILFMIVDTVDGFDWEKDNERLSRLPGQAEWEAYVAKFQGFSPDMPSNRKWQLMERIFKL